MSLTTSARRKTLRHHRDLLLEQCVPDPLRALSGIELGYCSSWMARHLPVSTSACAAGVRRTITSSDSGNRAPQATGAQPVDCGGARPVGGQVPLVERR